MSNWDLFRLLCRIVGGLDDTALDQVIQNEAFPQLMKLAGEYDVLPALAVRLNEQECQIPRIPSELNSQLQLALKANTTHKLQMVAQAVKVARILNAKNIEPLFLKGTALLLGESQLPIGFRKQIDIDLLVAPEHLATACEALTANGYRFYDGDRAPPESFADPGRALRLSRHHHHLPPLSKNEYGTALELHKQPLPRRFQKQLSVEQLLQTAISAESHGAKFLLPSPAFQLIHQVLGTFIHDSFAARFDFPIRAGQDYIEILLNSSAPVKVSLAIAGASGFDDTMGVFEQLVSDLMGLPAEKRLFFPCDIQKRLRFMEIRFNSPTVGRLLDLQARWRHLGVSLYYDSGKLPAYLRRRLQNRKPEEAIVSDEQ